MGKPAVLPPATATRPLHVLLVDDDPEDVELIMQAIRRTPFRARVSVAYDGEDAMQFLRREGCHFDAPRPDLVLLDIMMPGTDGREILAQIKEAPELRDITVIMVTSSTAASDVTFSYLLRANGYMNKPADSREFEELVTSINCVWLELNGPRSTV